MRIITGVLLALSVTVSGDSAVMFEFPDHRTVGLISSGEVTMLEESVTIVPAGGMYEPWDDGSGWLPRMRVSCMFRLLNTSDSVQEVTVGFPFDATYGNSYTVFSDEELVSFLDSSGSDTGIPSWERADLGEGSPSDRVPEELDFIAVADGDTLEVFYRDCARELDEHLIRWPTVAVWRMRFEPGQEVRLVNTYNTSWDYHAGGPDASYTMNYVVTSGATWAGDIGAAVITLHIPGDFPIPQMSDTLIASWEWTGEGELDIEGRTVTWVYTEWEPEENLSFRLHTQDDAGFWYESVGAADMERALDWTSEGLLPSAWAYLYDELVWVGRFHGELLLHMTEAVPYIRSGMSPPAADVLRYFSNVDILEHPEEMSPENTARLEVVREVAESLERDIALVEDAGYTPFLPVFRLRWKWDEDLSGMCRSEQFSLEAYRELTRAREALAEGESAGGEALEAFFRLTGAAYQD